MDTSVGDIAGEVRPLTWSRTVARETVHRSSVAEVLLTDVRRLENGDFEAAASWSRSHPTFPRDGVGLHSPLVIVETLRQLGIHIPLRYFAVPVSSRLLISDLYFGIDPSAEPRAVTGATGVTCLVRVSEVRRGPDDTVTGLRLRVRFSAHGVPFAQAGGGARFLDGEQYAARREGRTEFVSPRAGTAEVARPDARSLGVTGAHDVVIGLDGGGVLVAPADPTHPFFFDHATDHVPGMVLLEAARQAAAVESRGTLLRPASGRLKAARFVEFSPPARVLCVAHHETCVFRFFQDGEQKAFGILGYR
ncbi:ScbA/BarX family gamma-butyrolactone biosynthesis protein [Streptomyces sp. AK02-01A]|uniref:ScbA/BarX family gamma-butyrolactone biosynthesis protein n=1 Tax=Streptomyces sp. AK02-01A TaxID=3028648 RepID=UPI0029B8FBC9|nr:ScbA/BarX family gamma-butyrolactone biosynthesis protein [Streptomyces sp. AK02-01A]MDX3853378.1 ScbA/BarX family gamma-butyrolactone biosynthesis protein [Streptomyces sp. AK02-01A]